jgi:ribosomal-protein-alanine N-acetyltransferase
VKGYAVLSTGGGEAQLFNIAVSPDSQGRGLGRELLQWLIEQAKQQQAEMLFLEVRLSNQVAQLLYLDMGFNEIGLRKRYYRCNGGGREDALIYALQLQSENYFNLS